jgi:hypothetical protein
MNTNTRAGAAVPVNSRILRRQRVWIVDSSTVSGTPSFYSQSKLLGSASKDQGPLTRRYNWTSREGQIELSIWDPG